MADVKMPSGAGRFGYLMTIAINFMVMYAANNLHKWNTPYLTDQYSEVLWAINLSLSAAIFVHFIFLVFDRKWFLSLMKSLTNIFSFISVYVFRQVFPLNLSESMAKTTNLGLVILLLLILLSTLIELINSIKFYRNKLNG